MPAKPSVWSLKLTPYIISELKEASKDKSDKVDYETIKEVLEAIWELNHSPIIVLPEIPAVETQGLDNLKYQDIAFIEEQEDKLKNKKQNKILVPVTFTGLTYKPLKSSLAYCGYFLKIAELISIHTLVWLLDKDISTYAITVCSPWLRTILRGNKEGNRKDYEIKLHGIEVLELAELRDGSFVIMLRRPSRFNPNYSGQTGTTTKGTSTSGQGIYGWKLVGEIERNLEKELTEEPEKSSRPPCLKEIIKANAPKLASPNTSFNSFSNTSYSSPHLKEMLSLLLLMGEESPLQPWKSDWEFEVISSPLSYNEVNKIDEVEDIKRTWDTFKKVGMKETSTTFVFKRDLDEGEVIKDSLKKDEFTLVVSRLKKTRNYPQEQRIRELDILVTIKRKKGINVAIVLGELGERCVYIPIDNIAIVRLNARKYPKLGMFVFLMILLEFRKLTLRKILSISDLRKVISDFLEKFGSKLRNPDLDEVDKTVNEGRELLREILTEKELLAESSYKTKSYRRRK